MRQNTITSFDLPSQPLVKPDPQLEKLNKNNRRFKVRQQITLTEDGLMQVGLSSKVRSIPWSEARLFAILSIYGAKKYPSPALLELSSGNEIIRWSWIRKNSMNMWYFANSRVDTAEYEQQMNSALSIIVAKTGLPLYDLRK